ncbi:hypothetical protein BDW74DRAFT_152766 [Aspergillus multicolor]|uniref:uncharacterized protein n=1 Tax=Aspergillus multicolor TaxID=41759 RepID=UPI003CCD9B06
MPDCDGTILGYYDNILDSYDKILECYRTLNCCDETQECYKKISDYHNSLKGRGKTPERHGEQLDCYDQMLDCYKSIYNRCRGDVHVLLKDLVQSTEKTRDELSKLSVWKRAWVRPYMKDIDRGLKHLLVNTEKELRNTSEGTGESKMTLELDLPYGTKLDLPRGMVLPTASPASSRYARSDC